MSFRNIIHDMREEIGSISRKGFEAKLAYGLRSRSPRVVLDGLRILPIDALEQSCWANLPLELLRDVLVRIEESEGTWPPRKDVVSCAGVCRSWREIMKEIVKTPEVCGKLTFPISVKQPGSRGDALQCFIKRNRSSQTFYLYVGLTEVDPKNALFLNQIVIREHSDIGEIGTSNFLGTKFTVYDSHPPHSGAAVSKSRSTRLVGSKQISPRIPAGNYQVARITYELNVLGSRGPRRMHCVMDSIPISAMEPGGAAPTPIDFPQYSIDSFSPIPFFRSKSQTDSLSNHSSDQKEPKLILKNKAPRWHEQLQCWCLNFRGRVTVASVKNFQLVASEENGPSARDLDKVILQFGKVGKDLFTMDYTYPISAFQAFAICLSSFDTKIACE
ncbi:hypothetical protein HPP92_000378 [Vanilla planifolia]|uniref:Tubby-like F-box protein n=1 Tax=Vanilla planifolia TaxID=51239 RepID=A0A835S170_VANPL|nr:hypothetical protein HPP92_000378 [Vanilla planifolia]